MASIAVLNLSSALVLGTVLCLAAVAAVYTLKRRKDCRDRGTCCGCPFESGCNKPKK